MTDDYDAVTARDIADFLDHLARLRLGGHDDPDGRAAFLTHKAQLLTRIADQHADTDPGYSQEVRQSADDARAAARRCTTGLPQQRVGPNHRRTPHRPPDPGGATSQKAGSSHRRNTDDLRRFRWRVEGFRVLLRRRRSGCSSRC
jgi:hypothetical protein